MKHVKIPDSTCEVSVSDFLKNIRRLYDESNVKSHLILNSILFALSL